MANANLKNFMEVCVNDLLPVVIDNMTICKCEQCKLDIVAFALNHLPPKYVVTRKGDLYTRLEAMHSQFDADIITALSNGAKVVGENPRHE